MVKYYYAHIASGVAESIIESSGQIPGDSYVLLDSYDTTKLGCTYANGVFTPPAPVVAPPPPRLITPYAFKARMTSAERIAVRAAAVTTPAIHDYMDLLDSARQVDLDHADTVAGTQALEAGGLLAAGRAAAILDATVLDDERP
jgi:hypothetical protein